MRDLLAELLDRHRVTQQTKEWASKVKSTKEKGESHHSKTAVPIKIYAGSIRHDVIGFYNDPIEHWAETAEERAEATNNVPCRLFIFKRVMRKVMQTRDCPHGTQELHSLLREGRRGRNGLRFQTEQ
jgi:hypothetical protein